MEPAISSAIVSPLSIHEQLYLKFAFGPVQQKLIEKPKSIFIKTTIEKETAFKKFVEENYQDHAITDVNFSISETLCTVKERIITDLNNALSEEDLKDEHECQLTAYKKSIRRGKLGMVLTCRQAKVFLGFAELVQIPPSKKFKPVTLSPMSPKEKLYLRFVVDQIQASIHDKCMLFFLHASEEMQNKFILFAKQNKVTYKVKDLNLIGVINALVFRTQVGIKTVMDPMHIYDEIKCQKLADSVMKELEEANQAGRMITPRQPIALTRYNKGIK